MASFEKKDICYQIAYDTVKHLYEDDVLSYDEYLKASIGIIRNDPADTLQRVRTVICNKSNTTNEPPKEIN